MTFYELAGDGLYHPENERTQNNRLLRDTKMTSPWRVLQNFRKEIMSKVNAAQNNLNKSPEKSERPAPSGLVDEVEGLARISINMAVGAAEMRDWEPSRIAAFFHGIAQAQRAASGLPFGSVSPMLHCSCGAACTAEEYAEHRRRGHDSGND